MTTSPKIRDKVSISAGNKNRSLKDILAPMGAGVEVLKVEAINAPMHNTKATIRIDNSKITAVAGEYLPTERYSIRVIFYNRIDIATILPENIDAPLNNLSVVLKELNSVHQCDFTEDDIEILNNTIRAKETSLGYYNSGEVVVGGIPTDTVSFGVRTLPEGNGNKNSLGRYYYQKIVIAVNGVVYEAQPISSSGAYVSASDLVESIVDIFADQFPLIKATALQTQWFEDFYHGQQSEASAVVELSNLDETTPMDVTIQLHTLDRDGGFIMKYLTYLLPNARLQPKGSTMVDNGVDQMTLDEKECDLRYKPRNDDAEIIGNLFKINGSTHNLYLETTPGTNDLFDIRLTDGVLGLQNVLRTYYKPDEGGLSDPDMPVAFFKNLMETPLSVEHPSFKNPIKLLPTNTATPLDQVIVSMLDYSSRSNKNFNIVVGSDTYTIDLSLEEYTNASVEILIDAVLKISGFKEKIDIAILTELCRDDIVLYARNKTNKSVDFSVYYKDIDNIINNVIPPINLEPAGTKGLGFTVDDQNTTTVPAVTGLINNGSLKTITWRGVTTPVEGLDSGEYGWRWNETIWYKVLIAEFRNNSVIDYFHSRSPFKEEFIFNKGLPDEMKFHLEPKQLVDATKVPT